MEEDDVEFKVKGDNSTAETSLGDEARMGGELTETGWGETGAVVVDAEAAVCSIGTQTGGCCCSSAIISWSIAGECNFCQRRWKKILRDP